MRNINPLITRMIFIVLLFPFFAFANTDLELSLSVDNPNYEIYRNVSYTLTVTNTSAVNATNVQISFPLPNGMVYSSHSSSSGAYNLFFEEWSLSSIPANSSATLNLVLFTLVEIEPINAFAQILSAQPGDTDSTPGNGACCTPAEDDEAIVTIIPGTTSIADLELTMSVSGSQIYAGGPITITVTNKGPAKASNTVIRFTSTTYSVQVEGYTLTQGFTDIGSFGVISGENTWTVGNLEVGSSATMVLTAIPIDQYLTSYIFAQVESVDQSDPDSTPGNDTVIPNNPDEDDEARIIYLGAGGPPGDLELTKTVDNPVANAGEVVTFTITINNVPNYPGHFPVHDVTVKDALPEGISFVSSVASHGLYNQFSGIWDVGYIAETTLPNIHQISPVVTLDIIGVVQPGYPLITNFAQVQTGYDIDSSPGNNTDNIPAEDDEDEASIFVGGSLYTDLELSLVVAEPTYNIYENVSYTATVTNTSNVTANNVIVSFPLPYGMVFTSAQASQGHYSTWLEQWLVGSLAPGQSEALQLVLFTLIEEGPITAFTQIKLASPDDLDSTPGNDLDQTANEDDEAAVTIVPDNAAPLVAFAEPENLRLYPVPAVEALTLEFNYETEEEMLLSVIDMNGKILLQEKIKTYKGFNQTDLDINQLAPGVYWMHLSGENLPVLVRKFIKG